MMQSKLQQGGFTLIELGIVLALAALAIFFAVSKLTTTSNQTRAQNFAMDMSQAVTSTKRLYATQSDYSAITIAALRDNSVFPIQWKVGTKITGPWGGDVSASAATLNSANDAATLTIPNMPTEVCSEAVRALSGGIEKITVVDTVVKANNGSLNVATLGAQCASATAVDVGFTFGRM